MARSAKRFVIAGSEKTAMSGATVVGAVHPDERIEVTVRVRRRASLDSVSAAALRDTTPPHKRSYLTREAFAAQYGADPADLARVEAFAKAHALAVVESDVARRSVVLSGSASAMASAFAVKLQQMSHAGGTYRGRSGVISVPSDLAGIVEGVFGLDDRPQAEPHFQYFQPTGMFATRAAATSFTPTAIAKLYQFPAGLTGSGQCIAIIELGGGYRPADLQTYFAGLKLATPTVKAVLVDGAHNSPTTSSSADGEVMLDIEVAGAVAPKATLAVYFAPNTSQGFLDAITTAVHDKVNKPSVISISWGSAESNWTAQSKTQMDQAFQAAAAMGVTVCVGRGRQRIGRRRHRRQGARRLPVVEPVRARMRWHQTRGQRHDHFIRSGMERRHQQRDRRRRQHHVRVARVPEERRRAACRAGRQARGAWRARCRGRRRSAERLSGARRRAEFGHRRDQRGGAAMGPA